MDETPAKAAHVPAKKASPAVLAVCALILLFAIGLRIKAALDLRNPVTTEATLRGRTFHIEIADNVAKRDKGLGGRDSLPADQGMYFPFVSPQRWVFWMKDMRFPIDIIWIREGRIVDIEHSVPPPKGLPLETYSPIEFADAVLELNAGVAAEIGLKAGDAVCIGSCPAPAGPEERPLMLEPIPEPVAKTYPDEDESDGAYANREVGMAFGYPESWGQAMLREETFEGFDSGRRARMTFAATSTPPIDLFSSDWALGVGEGWSQRLQISGDPKDPIDTLTEAQARVHKDVVAFKKVAGGYRFGFQFTYGATRLLAVFLAPKALAGDYHDVQWVVDIDGKAPDSGGELTPPYTPEEASAVMARPDVRGMLDEIGKIFAAIHPYEG